MLEKAKLEKKIAGLESEKQAFIRSKSSSRSRLDEVVRTVDGNKELIARFQSDWDLYQSRVQKDKDGNILKYDIEAECHSVFANVKAVLEASSSCWDRIIDVTVFLTNMKKDFPVYNKIYADYFTTVQACRTTVEVKSLPTLIAIELKVIATIE